MANCGICNKKIGFLDESFNIQGIQLCPKCKERSVEFINHKNVAIEEDYEKAVESFLTYANNKDNAEIIIKRISDERLSERLKQEADFKGKEKVRLEKEAAEKAAEKKRKALSEMLISSGFSFDGYTIIKYSGYISGDDATQIPRSGVFGGDNGSNLTDALVKIRRQALIELKEAAYNLGCNAVVGVDFDYITLDPQTASLTGGTLYEPYVICVTANGNAVVIEKNT